MDYSMDESILQKLTIPMFMAEEALCAGNLTTAITRATMALDNLPQIEQELLTVRTTAYRRQRKFNEAYNDALILQEKMPYEFRGYIEAAQSLFQQEKITEAIKMCESILPERVVKFYTHIPEHKALLKLRRLAKHKLSQRVDLMKNLPYDIIMGILNQLAFGDILNCINVSKLWRQYILDSDTTRVQNFVLTDEMVTDYFSQSGSASSLLYRAVQLISDQVTSLKIHCSETQVQEVIHLLNNVSFTHLRSFEVGEDIGKWLPIANLLKGSSQELEEVYLDTSCEITLYEILNMCQSIRIIKCSTPLYPLKLLDTRQDEFYLHSTTLTHLHIITKGIQDEDIERILKGIINLRELMIAEDNPDFLNVLYKHDRRNLSHICFRPEGLHKDAQDDEDDADIDTTQFDRTIDIHHCDNITADLLLFLLRDQKCTEALSLTVSPASTLEDWSEIAYFASSHLRCLKFSFTKETEIVFASMIRKCPSLEQVIIHTVSHPPRLLLHTIQSSLPKLRCFAIENTPEYARGNPSVAIDDNELSNFFQHYESLGNRSPLEEIRLRNLRNVQPSTLLQLAEQEKLRTIHLVGLYHGFDNPGISPVIRALTATSLPLLEYLVFDGDDIMDYDIQGLDCTVLKLEYLPHITKSGIEGVTTHSKKLKKLIIRECEKLDRDVMEDLVAKRKDIKLIYYH